MIKNGNSISLKSASTLPNVAIGMNGLFQKMLFVKVVKEVINYVVTESYVSYNFNGVWQISSPEQVSIKPAEMRSWKFWTCHADTSLDLVTDDVIEYECVKYRVQSKEDYSKYGYYKYDLVEEFRTL